MVTVRTTFQPDKELDVTQREADDLRNQGLLVGSDVERQDSAVPVVDAEEQQAQEQAEAREQVAATDQDDNKRSRSSRAAKNDNE
jgi:hypothetical protein